MTVKEVEASEIEKLIEASDLPLLVDFYATWCGPCKAIAPILDNLSELYSEEINMVKVDISKHPEFAAKYNVRAVPTLLIFEDKAVISTSVGMVTKNELESKICEVI